VALFRGSKTGGRAGDEGIVSEKKEGGGSGSEDKIPHPFSDCLT